MVGMSQPPPLIALCARVLTFSDEGKRDAHDMDDNVRQPFFAARLGVPVSADRFGLRERNVCAHIRPPFLVGALS